MARDDVKVETLDDEADRVISEARMVLPGMQALFGFQLIAVFSERFADALPSPLQWLHLAAIVLVALAVALIMTPAAWHRQAEPGLVTRRFVVLTSTLLTSAMAPLGLGIALDVFIVAWMIVGSTLASAAIAFFCAAVIFGLWFVFPRYRSRPRKPSH